MSRNSNRKLYVPEPSKKETAKVKASQTKLFNSNTLNELKECYSTICVLEKRLETVDSFEFSTRQRLLEAHEKISRADIKFVFKYDLETRKWKSCVYNLIAIGRQKFTVEKTTELSEWNLYLEKVLLHYNNSLSQLKTKSLKPSIWAKPLFRMGDIWRYKTGFDEENRETFWGNARSLYNQYLHFVPGNGLVWNQLAIISNYKQLYLKSAMYYIRSLCVEMPFDSARESLLDLFHRTLDLKSFESGMILEGPLSIPLLKFERYFLASQHLLFTKIGIDSFENILTNFAKVLPDALNSILELDMKLQLDWWFTFSVIVIGNSFLCFKNPNLDSEAKKVLIAKSFDISFITISCCLSLSKDDHNSFDIFVELFLSWVATCGSKYAFEKQFSSTWELISTKFPPVDDSENDSLNIDEALDAIRDSTIGLPEDSFLRSFVPFMKFENQSSDAKDWSNFQFHSSIRRKRIQKLTQHLIKVGNIVFASIEIPSKDDTFVQPVEKQTVFDFEDFEEVLEDNNSNNNVLDNMDEISISSDEDVADLVSRKQNLQVSIQNVESRKMLIPGKTVIIFDTNMLLRNFAIVKKILESKCYPIVVPLTIIMELSGLAENKEKPHICDIATDILKYLKENLKSGKFVIESIKGNVLNSLDYLNEEWGSHIASADDAILAVCRNHSSVFLITDDKNLRLKARTVKVSVLSNLKQLV